jgi:hypothetical protein
MSRSSAYGLRAAPQARTASQRLIPTIMPLTSALDARAQSNSVASL